MKECEKEKVYLLYRKGKQVTFCLLVLAKQSVYSRKPNKPENTRYFAIHHYNLDYLFSKYWYKDKERKQGKEH